jgi:DhnA family fructose-bisphosphate aldolase class Ia
LTGKQIRLSRLLPDGENAVVIAIDHGEFDGPLPGMTNLPEAVKGIDPAVSAILLSPGMLPHCAHAFTPKGAPLAILRLNWNTVYCFHWNYNDANSAEALSPTDAAAAGADLVLVSLTLNTGSEARDAGNVELFSRLRAEAHRLGLPVVGEYFPPRSSQLSPEEMHDQILRGARITAELGADLIKTFYTPKFAHVTASCPIPVLGLGAEKLPTQLEALQLAERIVQAGGRGVVFGRNAMQVPDPSAFQRALCDIVRTGIPAAQAVKQHALKD